MCLSLALYCVMLSRPGAGASALLPPIAIIVASLQCFTFPPGGISQAAALFPASVRLPSSQLPGPAPSSDSSRRTQAELLTGRRHEWCELRF